MLTLADIFRVAGPAYVEAHAGRLLPSHRRAIDDLVACRTPALGGSLYRCDECAALDYAYHSEVRCIGCARRFPRLRTCTALSLAVRI